eukprot:924872_1
MDRKTEKSESQAQIKDIFAGCVAGAMSKIIEYPFDTLKVLRQIGNTHVNNQSTFAMAKHILETEGILRIYRGLSAPLIGSTFECLIIFWLFGSSERYLKKSFTNNKPLAPWQTAICSAIAGTGTTLWLTPVEFIKCQMQAPNTAAMYQNSTARCFIYTVTHHPLLLFNKNALIGTGCREITGSVIWFGSYKLCTRSLTRYYVGQHQMEDIDHANVPNWIYLVGGATAGVTYWSCCYPFDLIKSIIQTEEVGKSKTEHVSFWRQLYNRYTMYGFRSLYNGLGVTIPRAFISNGFIFFAYEYSRNYLDKMTPSDE